MNSDNITIKRKDRVYDTLYGLTKDLFSDDLKPDMQIGFEAGIISKETGILRNNVSKELNTLFREKKVVKIMGKTVCFLHSGYLEDKFDIGLKSYLFENQKDFLNLIKYKDIGKNDNQIVLNNWNDNHVGADYVSKNTFENIIGSKDSLKLIIDRVKAAVLYPPNGLNTLITGATGTGKSMLAEAMYMFSCEVGRLKADAPFIVFNCADYSENPELLNSALFGHAKGAFTGAENDKQGLAEKADGGILFLDEVHRLPPEGQEMLFLLMDKGVFRRLGEAESARHAKIFLIAATTENIDSIMLSTFVRRFPVLVNIPNLEERTLNERLDFINYFFHEESLRVNMPIKVSKGIVQALLLYDCPGNIGQLKSDIQMLCAISFLDYIRYKYDYMEVKLSYASCRLMDGFYRIRNNNKLLMDILGTNYNDDYFYYGIDKPKEQFNVKDGFYESIAKKWEELSDQGLNDTQKRREITIELNKQFDTMLSKVKLSKSNSIMDTISKIVEPRILDIIRNFKETYSNSHMSEREIYGLALHMNSILERTLNGNNMQPNGFDEYSKEYTDENVLAKTLIRSMEDVYSVQIPENEIHFLTMFLHTIGENKNDNGVIVLVITHGQSAASTMIDVASSLLGIDYGYAIDMPLEERIQDAFERVLCLVKKIDCSKGVLILVDMGSTINFGHLITSNTGIKTKTIDKVSMPMVLEAVSKAVVPGMDLDTLYKDVISISTCKKQEREIPYAGYSYKYLANCDPEHYKDIMVEIIESTLTFLNPQKVCDILMSVLKEILNELNVDISNSIITKFFFHCSCMIERSIRKESFSNYEISQIKSEYEELFALVRAKFVAIEECYAISIPDDEIAYVVEMLGTSIHVI